MNPVKFLGLNKFFRKDSDLGESPIITLLRRIKDGDAFLREKFINDYKPFIISTTKNFTDSRANIESTDEYSIGILAFNEAIDRYDIQRKASFFQFAEMVIRSRIIDYKRKNKMPFHVFSEIENFDEFEQKYLSSDFADNHNELDISEELQTFEKILSEYGIKFKDLVECSPKHYDSRILCIKVAKILANDNELYAKLIRTKSIPRNELSQKAEVHRRTLENNRKYIIAICIILKSNFVLINKTLENLLKGGAENGINRSCNKSNG